MKWFGAIEFAEEDGDVRCTSRPLTTIISDAAMLSHERLRALGYRFVERLHSMRADRWARWYIAPFLRASIWVVAFTYSAWLIPKADANRAIANPKRRKARGAG